MSKLHTLLVLSCLASLLIAHHAAAQPPTTPTYFTEACRTKYGNYTTNGTYESNLKSVLISLQASNASSSNTSTGSGADMVYGQYYCRGDISTQLCRDCIKEAAVAIFTNCSNFKGAVMWYEECTLRYLNQSMLGIMEELPYAFDPSIANVTDPEEFGVVLRETRDKVVETASYDNGSLHFATGEGVVSQFETVYYLVQCSPDLDDRQCEACLRSLYKLFTTQYPDNIWPQFMIAFYSGCQMRYSAQEAFYLLPNSTVSQASPTPQPAVDLTPPSPTTAAKEKDLQAR
ncbi:hypothetical protein V2J09_002700 [Rumex salicifolius]